MSALRLAIAVDAVTTPCEAIHREVATARDRDQQRQDNRADLVSIARIEDAVAAARAALADLADLDLSGTVPAVEAEVSRLRAMVAAAEDAAEFGLSLCFSPRTTASRRYLRATIETSKDDTRDTLVAIRDADATYTVHGVRCPSQPGAPAQAGNTGASAPTAASPRRSR
jgi:hypothetical protein